jgi:uncharacterized protein (DUF885 family)
MKIKFLLFFFTVTILLFGQKNTAQDVEKIFNSFFKEYIQIDPDAAAALGDIKNLGFSYSKDRFRDYSPDGDKKYFAFFKKYDKIVKSVDQSKIKADQQVPLMKLRKFIDYTLEGEKFKDFSFIPTYFDGMHNIMLNIMSEYHTIENEKDINDYIARLHKYKERIDQEIANLNIRISKKIIPPKNIIETSEKVLRDFVKQDVKENPLYSAFKEKLDLLKNISNEKKELYLNKVTDGIKKYVYPSYDKFIKKIELLKSSANEVIGLWNIPGGDEYYKYCLKYYTTTNLTPEEIHQMGLKEVDRLSKVGIDLFKTIGNTEDKTFGQLFGEFMRKIYTEKKSEYYYPDSEGSRDLILNDYKKMTAQLWALMPEYFSVMPKQEVIIEAAPKEAERVNPPQYVAGSIDGKRPGKFVVPIVPPGNKISMKSLIVHEAIPGHHFQIQLGIESKSARLIENLFFFGGYIEGWALYSERLAMEEKWFDKPYEILGCIFQQLGRAIRLVVDTGVNAKKWTREDAYNYMRKVVGTYMPNEVNRFIFMPGQACSYKVGELKIVELKEKAINKLGSKFNLKEFHNAVLQNGSLPLELLETEIDKYIKEKSTSR